MPERRPTVEELLQHPVLAHAGDDPAKSVGIAGAKKTLAAKLGIRTR